MDKSYYFSSGELANLVGISKQILRYYEKNDILIPDFTDDNGYRYYKPETYFTLELILSLRKLDVPLKSIKYFLENRNLDSLKKFYLEHIEKLENIKKQICTYQNYFEQRLRRLEEIKNIPINTIMIVPTLDYDVIVSDEIPINLHGKQRLCALANFLRPLLNQKEYRNYMIGYMTFYQDLLDENSQGHFHAIFPAEDLAEDNLGSIKHIEGSLCLSIVFKDNHGRVPLETVNIIKDYIKHNNLKIKQHVYVYAIGDHWCSKKWDDVLCRLYIPIESNN